MEPVAVLAEPDLPQRTTRKLKKRAGRTGAAQAWVALLIPHVWIGIGLIVGSIWQLAFPLVAHDVDGHLVGKHENYSTKSKSTSYVLVVGYELDREPNTLEYN